MGKVGVWLRLTTAEPNVDLEKIKEKLKDACREIDAEVLEIREEPIAFGIYAIKMIIARDEELGWGEKEEKKLKVEGISSVEVERVSLI